MTQSKVFKSANGGCCICRLKSSSSRFTSSNRYEDSFAGCFLLVSEKRSGDICNACVLLVKRWRALYRGKDNRNWSHVVDSKARYGKKPVRPRKTKVLRDCRPIQREKSQRRKLLSDEKVNYSATLPAVPASPSGSECSETAAMDTTNTANYGSGVTRRKKKRRKRMKREKYFDFPASVPPSVRSYVDLDFWKMQKTCCGLHFQGSGGRFLFPRELFKPCSQGCFIYWSKRIRNSPKRVTATTPPEKKPPLTPAGNFRQPETASAPAPAPAESQCPVVAAPPSLPGNHCAVVSAPLQAENQNVGQVAVPLDGKQPGTKAMEVHCLPNSHQASLSNGLDTGCAWAGLGRKEENGHQKNTLGGGSVVEPEGFPGCRAMANPSPGNGYAKGLRLEVSCSSQTHSFLGRPHTIPPVGCVPQKAVQ